MAFYIYCHEEVVLIKYGLYLDGGHFLLNTKQVSALPVGKKFWVEKEKFKVVRVTRPDIAEDSGIGVAIVKRINRREKKKA
jgi:hypothetical protein